MISFIREFYEFLKEREKYWSFFMVFVLAPFDLFIVLSRGSAVAPFINKIF